MPPGPPDLSIVIPHYEDPERLARCLDALMAQDPGGAEVVVIDNASPRRPPPPELVAAHPGVRFVTEDRKGAAHARNRGVTETTAPTILFLDADCVPLPGWLDAARAARGRAPLVGGRIDTFDETPPPRSGAEAFEAVFAFDTRRYVEEEGFSVTANLMAARAAFDAVGGFVDGVSEDKDWTQRAVAAGHALVYEDAMAVRHPTRADWPALRKKWRRLTDEAWNLHRAGRAGARARAAWAGRALLMPASILAHLPRVLSAPALAPPERARAALTLARVRLLRMAWMLAQAVRP